MADGACVVFLVMGRKSAKFGEYRGQSLPASDLSPIATKKAFGMIQRPSNWVQGLDLNQRPSGYEIPEGVC
jgi:hypothetical protein